MTPSFSKTVLYMPYNVNRIWPAVNSKQDFVRRYSAGEFGNASPTWNNAKEFVESENPGYAVFPPRTYHIRNRIAGGPTYYGVMEYDVCEDWCHLVEDLGVKPETLYISAMAPHEHGTIQGEVQETPQGLSLFYASAKEPMRDALRKSGRQVYGIMASSLLRVHLCPNSHEWLMTLLERYPGHVVEFSSFSQEWGTLPGYNTVFWEIRNY